MRSCADGSLIISGGFGPTFEPRKFLDDGFDYIIRGEGEETILDIVKILSSNLLPQSISQQIRMLNNIAYLDGEKLCINEMRPLILMDMIPTSVNKHEQFYFIENNELKNYDPMLKKGIYIMSTSRGCVGRCTYCAGGNWIDMYKSKYKKLKRYRIRPINDVLDECENAKKYGVIYILFTDEYFVRPEKDFFYFFNEYKRRINLPYELMVHTSFLDKDEERFNIFFQSGINCVEIGVQSACSFISRDVFNRKISSDLQLKMIYKFYDHWISTSVDFISGHILESEKDFLETVNFVSKLPFDPLCPKRCWLSSFILSIIPGATIIDNFPQLKTSDIDNSIKIFRQRILYLRHIIKDDDKFFNYFYNENIRKNPFIISDIINNEYEEILKNTRNEVINSIYNKPVYFYGCGKQYKKFIHNFKNTKPIGILLDQQNHNKTKHIDSIPILNPQQVLCDEKNFDIPIVIFSTDSCRICANILRHNKNFRNLIPFYDSSYRTDFIS